MLPPGKEKQMVFKIILIIIAFVMLCGMVADESRYNKRTYCDLWLALLQEQSWKEDYFSERL